MDKGKHTPGPWKVSHDLGDGYSIAREVDGHNSASGKLLPVALAVFTSGNYNETENRAVASANAHLIAAAPELLEAAKWALNQRDYAEVAEAVHRQGGSPKNGGVWTALKKAIAKAEGRE